MLLLLPLVVIITPPLALSHELVITVGDIPRTLTYTENDDLRLAAQAFVEEHGGLSGGEGCRTESCVTSMLVTAMRRQLGNECVDGSSDCVTRVSVAGEIYRRQGIEELSRQLEEVQGRGVAFGGTATEKRTVRAPCVPPECTTGIVCATASAAVETETALDFIATNPELSILMARDPEPSACDGGPIYPIFIGIPATEFVECVPRKHYSVQGGVGEANYRFGPGQEAEYKSAYRDAYFGVTKRKAGWDCLRHYEIIASGAIPFFSPVGTLESCPKFTMAHWPKKLLTQLSNITYLEDVNELDAAGLYAPAAAGLLAYARARLSTEALADYLLRASGHSDAKKVLLLSTHPDPDYMRDMLIHGLRSKLGPRGLIDFIRPPHMYHGRSRSFNFSENANLYGHGFTYAHRLRDDEDFYVDRTQIEERIRRHEFDVVVYASVHRGMPFWPAVYATYSKDDLIFVDGEDEHGWCPWSTYLRSKGHFFMREIPDGDCPPPITSSESDQHRFDDPSLFLGPFSDLDNTDNL